MLVCYQLHKEQYGENITKYFCLLCANDLSKYDSSVDIDYVHKVVNFFQDLNVTEI